MLVVTHLAMAESNRHDADQAPADVTDSLQFVVIVSADAEWDAVAELFPDSTMDRSAFGQFFHGAIAGRRGVVMQGGWGKIDRSSRSSLWIRLNYRQGRSCPRAAPTPCAAPPSDRRWRRGGRESRSPRGRRAPTPSAPRGMLAGRLPGCGTGSSRRLHLGTTPRRSQ